MSNKDYNAMILEKELEERLLALQYENTTLNNRVLELEKQLKSKNYLLKKANIDIEKKNREIDRTKHILHHQIEIARKIQEHLITTKDMKLYSLSFKFSYVPAFGIGGDYLDVIDLKNGKVGVFVLDVSGKSIAAALIMAMTKVLFLKQSSNYMSPKNLMRDLNKEFREIFNEGFDDIYCTAFYGVIDTINKRITYCNAGHPNPIVFNGGIRKEFEANNLPIGLFSNVKYKNYTISYNDSDKIVFYTDGLLELLIGSNISKKDEMEFIEYIVNIDLQRIVEGKQLKDDISIILMETA